MISISGSKRPTLHMYAHTYVCTHQEDPSSFGCRPHSGPSTPTPLPFKQTPATSIRFYLQEREGCSGRSTFILWVKSDGPTSKGEAGPGRGEGGGGGRGGGGGGKWGGVEDGPNPVRENSHGRAGCRREGLSQQEPHGCWK